VLHSDQRLACSTSSNAGFALITSQAIRRSSFASVVRLEQAVIRFLAHWNEHARPFL